MENRKKDYLMWFYLVKRLLMIEFVDVNKVEIINEINFKFNIYWLYGYCLV